MIEVIVSVGAALTLYLAVEAVLIGISWGFRKLKQNGIRKKCEEYLVTLPLTEEDQRLIECGRILMKEFFPVGIEQRFKHLTLEQRVELMKALIERVNRLYDVDIDLITFAPAREIGSCTLGFFDRETNGITINLDILASDEKEVIHAMVATVFHECRHALQYRAVTDDTFNYGSEEQLHLWALNFMEGNYIPAEVDFVLYQQQTVEADARQIAEKITENF